MRQRQPVPVMALRRYLRSWDEHFKYLTQLERSLNITDANYKNIRRAVADFKRLDTKTRAQTIARLKQMLQSKLPNTDIQRQFKEF